MVLMTHYPSQTQVSQSDSVTYSQQLIRIEQQCMDDVSGGIIKTFNTYMHADCFVITEDGTMLTKQDFLAGIHPLPKGYSGNINVTHPKTVFYGNTAVIQYVADEYENVFASKLHTMYSVMNTYIKIDTSWQMISSQIFEIPLLPPSINVPASLLEQYTGLYKLSDSVTCTVSLQNDTLYSQKTGRAKIALFPETENVFFRAEDARGRKMFVRDERGTMLMRERRNGQDVVWEKLNNQK